MEGQSSKYSLYAHSLKIKRRLRGGQESTNSHQPAVLKLLKFTYQNISPNMVAVGIY